MKPAGCPSSKTLNMKTLEPGHTTHCSPKRPRRVPAPAAWLAGLLLTAGHAGAQSLALDWHSIDGGGGTSSGGNFAVSGTIGQADASAAPMTGGVFSLAGGFWSVFAVQRADGPLLLLEIRLTSPTTAVLSWPSPSPGFVLEQNSDLNAANWTPVPGTVSDNGTTRFVTVPVSGSRRFFRLAKP